MDERYSYFGRTDTNDRNNSGHGGLNMSDIEDDPVAAYNYVRTEGAITGPTLDSTWQMFHRDEFWGWRLYD